MADNKIVKSFLNTPLTLILILLIILIIYCVMKYKLYNLQEIMYDEHDNTDNTDNTENIQHINTNTKKNLSNISSEEINIKIKYYIITLNDIIDKSKVKIKENFDGLTYNELQSNLTNLQALTTNLNNFQTNDLVKIKNSISDISDKRLVNKDKILELLTNIYTLRYIEYINQGNAASYNEYNKYLSPKQNIFYKQYL